MLRVNEIINYSSTEVRRPLKAKKKMQCVKWPGMLYEVCTEGTLESAYLWLGRHVTPAPSSLITAQV